ncbi:MAG TPA: dual specificity protein phosphatase family protein [Pyrinomonadaceae bacterium]|nr:dual specificity protein phosphatase family protein [Pyrinomonadaceae bacterium]
MKPDVYWIEGPWPGKLAILARPRGEDWLEDEVVGWKNSGVNVVVSLLTRDEDYELGLLDECKLVQRHGLTFISFPISDYSVPTSTGEIRQLVSNLEQSLKRGDSVGIHCRQGIGRSSLVAACVLVTSGESPSLAFEHISSARGRSVPDTPEQRNWVTAFASET